MNKEAFIQGMMKAASEDSSLLGRYFVQKTLPGAAAVDNRVKSLAGALVHNAIAQPLHFVGGIPAPLAANIGAPIGESINALILGGGDEDTLNKKYKDSLRRVERMGVGQNMGYTADKMAPFGAIPGGLAGLIGGAIVGHSKMHSPAGIALGALGGGLGGAALGGGLGMGLGGLAGLIQSLILKNTSQETKERALAMKSKHPYATALPFGDMIGAVAA